MSDLQLLRDRFEFWKVKYNLTKDYKYYILFQKNLREYMQLIDSGKVAKTTLERITRAYDSAPLQDRKTSIASHRLSMSQMSSKRISEDSPIFKDIVTLFNQESGFLTLQDIMSQVNVSHQYARQILRHLMGKDWLEEQRDQRRLIWRKKHPEEVLR